MHWGFASATRFGGSEPGVAPATPRVYGHTCKQGTTPTLAENESKVDCGTYGTENRRGFDYLPRIFVAWTSYAYNFLVACPYIADRGVFRGSESAEATVSLRKFWRFSVYATFECMCDRALRARSHMHWDSLRRRGSAAASLVSLQRNHVCMVTHTNRTNSYFGGK